MKKLNQIFVSIFTIVLLLAGGSVAFGGQEKQDVCHITGTMTIDDAEVPVGHIIHIADPAWDAHYAHGDPASHQMIPETAICTEFIETGHARLVVAYIDVDSNDRYDPTTDILIAEIIDTAPPFQSIGTGDTINTAHYPIPGNDDSATWDQTIGTFANTSYEIGDSMYWHVSQSDTHVYVTVDVGLKMWSFVWRMIPDDAEYYEEGDTNTHKETAIYDHFQDDEQDQLRVAPESPSNPATAVPLTYGSVGATDNDFIDVDIY